MLFVEYDVDTEGYVHLVALVNAVEEDGEDPDGEAWLAWRRTHDDEGLGCAPVPPAEVALLEAASSPDEARAVVERIVLADRAAKEPPS